MGKAGVRRTGVVGGVMLLTLSGLLVKAIGVFYKIPLSFLLGDEGMGYFNISYTIYAWLYMLSTAGIPVALSIMVSEYRARGDRRAEKRLVAVSARALVMIGMTSTLFLLSFSSALSQLLGSKEARCAILAIAPTLFFISVTSFFRGFFQGHGNMLPTALSQLIEAVGKVVFGVFFAYHAVGRGYSYPVVAAYAVMGVTVGTAFCTLYLFIHYVCTRNKIKEEMSALPIQRTDEKVGLRLFTIALPITISASVMSLTGLIDLGMIIRRLVSFGLTTTEATALYGNYSTLVVPVFNLPTVFITPITTGVIPALSRAHATQDRESCRRLLQGAFRAVGIISIPCALGLAVFSRPILLLLYPAASAESAYRLLSLLSPAVVFVCSLTPVNAALQACGSSRAPVISMFLGGGVKVILGYVLIGQIGIAGAPIGTLACYLTALTVGYLLLAKQLGYLPSLSKCYVRPLVASVVSIGASSLLYYRTAYLSQNRIGIVVCIVLSVVVYTSVSFAFGSVDKEDLAMVLKTKKA